MKDSRILEIHAILKDPAASVDAKADAILTAIAEHSDGVERRELLKRVLDGIVTPKPLQG
ncbi:MAG TPA: hypothetical protein VEW05_28170 [Candidatus Polarisedimenticolia bacterium]|nr:hypothetical protein [Candidatus Polarisedimenticolia bacterium]